MSSEKLFAGKIYQASSQDLEDKMAALKKENGQLKQERDSLTGKLNRALKAGGNGRDKPAKFPPSSYSGADANSRGGRGGGRGRGGRTDSKPTLGTWTRKDKLDMTCAAWNKGDQCDGTKCGKEHKCSKEEQYGRFCWARDHTEKDHK